MALTDFITIQLAAGSGGDGVIRWRREKYIPRGGPSGGDGGRGGSIYLQGVKDNTVLDYYAGKALIKADSGKPGGAKGLYGENGEDLVLSVPIGTLVTNKQTNETVDVINSDKVKILTGGHGGLGNIHFKSATNQTPFIQTDGKPGGRADFSFELQLIADIGAIGLPNAGKSSLVNFITNSKTKIGAYQFTTLEPYLGSLPGNYIIADIPGLIAGAASGKGLGHKFLQHIKRTRILAHCLSLESADLETDYKVIRKELEDYSAKLAKKTEQVILTKSDTVDEQAIKEALKIFPKALVVSVLDDDSVKDLQDSLIKLLQSPDVSDA